MHTAMTYSGSGSWFYTEVTDTHSRSNILLTVYIVISNAYLMSFFFLLAGYFTPDSFQRKGWIRFLLDRFIRLGIPLLMFCSLVGPFTVGLVAHFQNQSFLRTIYALLLSRRLINGPMWFAEALLMFALGYCAWRIIRKKPTTAPKFTPVPASYLWLLSSLGVGLAALILRQFFPIDRRVAGVWLGNFAPYIFFFCIGIKARRTDWLNKFGWKQAYLSIAIAALAIPSLPAALIFFYRQGGTTITVRGLSWMNVFYAFWEPLLAFGVIAALILAFRSFLNNSSSIWMWLDRRAYAVYFIHPPVLVALSLAFEPWHTSALIKFICIGVLGCATTWIVADPLVRLPGFRRIF
jgi:hypothetical protein